MLLPIALRLAWAPAARDLTPRGALSGSVLLRPVRQIAHSRSERGILLYSALCTCRGSEYVRTYICFLIRPPCLLAADRPPLPPVHTCVLGGPEVVLGSVERLRCRLKEVERSCYALVRRLPGFVTALAPRQSCY